MLHRNAHFVDGGAAFTGNAAAFVTGAFHELGRICSLRYRAGNLFHGRSGLLQAAGLRFGAPRQIKAALRNLVRRLTKAANFGAHIAHHCSQIDLNLLQPEHQRTHGAVIVLIACGAEITGRHIGSKAACLLQTRHAAAGKAPQHKQATRNQTGGAPAPGCCALPAQHIGQHDQHSQQRQQPGHAGQQANILATIPPAQQSQAPHFTRAQPEAALALLGLCVHAGIQSFSARNFLARGLGSY